MKLIALIVLIYGLIACGDGVVQENEPIHIPEYKIGVTAPQFEGLIYSDSPYAGVRLVLIEEQIINTGFDRQNYFEYDEREFRAIHSGDDTDTSDAYKNWLLNNQEIIQAVHQASELKEFFPRSHLVFFDKFADGDPRREYIGAFREIANLMKAESARLWFEGDHSAAIDCIDSLLSLTILSREYSNRSVLESIMANAVAEIGLEHYQWMVQNSRCTETDRNDISNSLRLLAGSDPLKLNYTTSLHMSSVHQWLEKQMTVEGGSDELWYAIGVLHSTQNLVNLLFEKNEDEAIVSIDQEESKRKILEQLDGISFEDIVLAYEKLSPLAHEIGTSLIDDSTDIDRLKVIADMSEDDETGIGDILMLSVARSVYRNQNRIITQRDELLRILEE